MLPSLKGRKAQSIKMQYHRYRKKEVCNELHDSEIDLRFAV